MLTEYTSSNFSAVRWASADNASSLSTAASSERYLLTASADTEPEPEVRVYSFQDTADDVQLLHKHSYRLDSAATQLITFGRDYVFCICSDSSAHLLSVVEQSNSRDSGLYTIESQQEWKQLDRYRLTDVSYCKPSSCVVAAGAEGKLHFFDLSTSSPTHQTSKKISHSSINCVETLNRNEVLVGNETGDLKLFDMRTGNVEMSLGKSHSFWCLYHSQLF
jgi:WD40 repeat protein